MYAMEKGKYERRRRKKNAPSFSLFRHHRCKFLSKRRVCGDRPSVSSRDIDLFFIFLFFFLHSTYKHRWLKKEKREKINGRVQRENTSKRKESKERMRALVGVYVFLIHTWQRLIRDLRVPAFKVFLSGFWNCCHGSIVANQKLNSFE